MTKAVILFGLFFVLSIFAIISYAIVSRQEEGVVCTLDAKQCPDGSYVGRTPPYCEFATCPSESLCEGAICSPKQ